MKHKLLIIFTALLLTCIVSTSHAAAGEVKVIINNKLINNMDQKPFIDTEKRRTYVPLRFVSEALGAKVSWDDSSQTATVEMTGKKIIMTIGNDYAIVNGQKVRLLDAPARMMNQRTMVPLRFVSECLNQVVDWNTATKTVTISTLKDQPAGDKETVTTNAVKKVEETFGIKFKQEVPGFWRYIPPWSTIDGSGKSYARFAYFDEPYELDPVMVMDITWPDNSTDIRPIPVDFTPMEKFMEAFFPGDPQNAAVLAYAKEVTAIVKKQRGDPWPPAKRFTIDGHLVKVGGSRGAYACIQIWFPK